MDDFGTGYRSISHLRDLPITGIKLDRSFTAGITDSRTREARLDLNPGTGVEVLIPDFSGKPDLLQQVFDARPAVLAHNLETVPRIFKRIRPAFAYEGRSPRLPGPSPRGSSTGHVVVQTASGASRGRMSAMPKEYPPE
jgi:lipoic acid synthetase